MHSNYLITMSSATSTTSSSSSILNINSSQQQQSQTSQEYVTTTTTDNSSNKVITTTNNFIVQPNRLLDPILPSVSTLQSSSGSVDDNAHNDAIMLNDINNYRCTTTTSASTTSSITNDNYFPNALQNEPIITTTTTNSRIITIHENPNECGSIVGGSGVIDGGGGIISNIMLHNDNRNHSHHQQHQHHHHNEQTSALVYNKIQPSNFNLVIDGSGETVDSSTSINNNDSTTTTTTTTATPTTSNLISTINEQHHNDELKILHLDPTNIQSVCRTSQQQQHHHHHQQQLNSNLFRNESDNQNKEILLSSPKNKPNKTNNIYEYCENELGLNDNDDDDDDENLDDDDIINPDERLPRNINSNIHNLNNNNNNDKINNNNLKSSSNSKVIRHREAITTTIGASSITTAAAATATTTAATTTTTAHSLKDKIIDKITIHMNADSLSSVSSMDFDSNKLVQDQDGYQDNTSSNSQQSGGGGSVNGSGGGGGGSGGGGGTGGNGNSGGNTSGGGNSGAGSTVGNNTGLSGNNSNNNNNDGLSGLIGLGGGNNNVLNGSGNSSYASLLPPPVCTTGGNTQPGSGDHLDFKYLFEELCPVCGDKVSGYHYGLLTCESCKGFFKRTVQNKKVYTCVAERSCHIDKTQRKRCPFCRFQKCLEVGMKLEAVRADRMRGGRNKFGPMYKRDRARKLQMMRQRQLALQAIRTSMGSADIKPGQLSPIGYQQSYPNMNIKQEIQIPQISSLTQSPDSSPSPIAIVLGQVPNATTIATSLGCSSNLGSTNTTTVSGTSSGGTSSAGNCGQDSGSGTMQHTTDSKLCFDSGTNPSSTADSMSNVEPLRVSPMIREFVQSIDDREWQSQLFALLQKQSYNQVEVDLFELMCKVLDQNLFSQVDWARNTIFFKDLKVDDQMKLLQHSWSDMLVLDHLHQRIHNGLPDETPLHNGQIFNLLGLGLLGVPQLADYFNELQNKLTELKFDMGDYVCMKFLILLNPNVRGIVNRKTVLEGHENVQAALLDYTLTCYPSVTDKFSRLLSILPEIHAMATRGEEHLYGKHCAGSAPTQTLLMEMLHAKRKV